MSKRTAPAGRLEPSNASGLWGQRPGSVNTNPRLADWFLDAGEPLTEPRQPLAQLEAEPRQQ